MRAVGRGDARAHALPGVDGHRVRGAAAVLVDAVHRGQLEPVTVRDRQRHADVTGRVADHERDELRRGHLGREDEVAFVLAVSVVDDNDRLACRNVGDGSFDR